MNVMIIVNKMAVEKAHPRSTTSHFYLVQSRNKQKCADKIKTVCQLDFAVYKKKVKVLLGDREG